MQLQKFIDDYLTKSGRADIDPLEANALLAKAGILKDSKDRPGKPLRDLLRKGQLPHAFKQAVKVQVGQFHIQAKGKVLLQIIRPIINRRKKWQLLSRQK